MRIEAAWIPDIVRSAFQPTILPKTEGEGKFLINTEAELSILSPEFQEIFIRFQESKLCGAFIDQIARVEYEPQLAGYFFELLSYFFLESTLQPDEFLLSPSDTESFYRSIGIISQQGEMTIPDGILFRKQKEESIICSFCEYSVSRYKAYKTKQSRYYQSQFTGRELDRLLGMAGLLGQRFLPTNFPNRLSWSGSFKIIYAVPEDGNIARKNPVGNTTEVIRLPITYQEFGRLFGALLSDISY